MDLFLYQDVDIGQTRGLGITSQGNIIVGKDQYHVLRGLRGPEFSSTWTLAIPYRTPIWVAAERLPLPMLSVRCRRWSSKPTPGGGQHLQYDYRGNICVFKVLETCGRVCPYHCCSSARIIDAVLAAIAEVHLHDRGYNDCLRPGESPARRGVLGDDLLYLTTPKGIHPMQRESKYPRSAIVRGQPK